MELDYTVDTKRFRSELNEHGLAKCPDCELAFMTLHGIKKHISDGCKRHLESGDYVACRFCSSKFSRLSQRESHEKKAHPYELMENSKYKNNYSNYQDTRQKITILPGNSSSDINSTPKRNATYIANNWECTNSNNQINSPSTENINARVVKTNLPLSGSVLQSHKLSAVRTAEYSQEPADYGSIGIDQDNVYPAQHSSAQVKSDYYSRHDVKIQPTASHQTTDSSGGGDQKYVKLLQEDGKVLWMKLSNTTPARASSTSGTPVRHKLLLQNPIQHQTVSSNFSTPYSSVGQHVMRPPSHHTSVKQIVPHSPQVSRPIILSHSNSSSRPQQQQQSSASISDGARYVQIVQQQPYSSAATTPVTRTNVITTSTTNRLSQIKPKQMQVRILNPLKPQGMLSLVSGQPSMHSGQPLQPGIVRLTPASTSIQPSDYSSTQSYYQDGQQFQQQVYLEDQRGAQTVPSEDNWNNVNMQQQSTKSSHQYDTQSSIEDEEVSPPPQPQLHAYLDGTPVSSSGPSYPHAAGYTADGDNTSGSGERSNYPLHDDGNNIRQAETIASESQYSTTLQLKTEVDNKLWGSQVAKREVVSPIVLKEKKLKEEEDRILELEAMAKQYILAAEKVKKEHDRERELALKKKEEELKRREEAAQRLLEEAKRVIEGYAGREEVSTPGMEVAEMTRFTEDPTAGKLSQEAEPVSLTHEELQALSPSERPKNVMVVDRRINSTEDLREQNNLNSLNTLESGSQETSSISESQLSNFSSEQELSSLQESQSHEGVPVPHNQMKLCQQQPELPEPSSILQHSYNPANPSTSHNWEQQTTNNYQNPNAQNSNNSTFVTPGYIDRTGPGVQQQQCQPSTSARSEFKYHYQDSIDDANQDKPLDLSKHCGDPAADTSFNDLSKSSETEVVNEISSADKNLINEAIAESNKETFTATADIDTDDIIFPFPEFGNENLEKLLNESPDGNMLIISVEDGKLMLPTLSNVDKDSMNTGDAEESSDLTVNNQISKETEITTDITHDKIDDQDDITSDISIGNNQDNAEGDNINSVMEDSSKDPLALSDDDHDVNDGNDNDLEDDICDSINGSVSLNISDNNENSTYKIEKSVIKVKKLSLPPEVSPQPSRRSSRLSTKNKHLKSKHKSSSNKDIALQSSDSGCKNNSKSLSELKDSTENAKTDIKTEKVLRSKLGKGPKNEKITSNTEDKKEEKSKDSPEVTSSRPKRKLGLRPDKVTLEEDDAKENLSASDDEEVLTATKRSKRTRASRQIISDDDEISDNEKKDKVVAKSVRPKRKLEALSEQISGEEDDQYDFAVNEEISRKPSNKRQRRPLVRADIKKKNPEEIVLSLKRSFRRNIRARDSINSDTRQSSELCPPVVEAEGFGRKRRAAAKRAERKFLALSKNCKIGSDDSDFSDIFSDDSEDNFDLSKEVTRKKMYKIEHTLGGEDKLYRCMLCTETFPNKNKIDSHFIGKHSRELFTQEQESDEDEYCERENSCNRSSRFRKGSSEGRPGPTRMDPDPKFLEREEQYREMNYYPAGSLPEWYARLCGGIGQVERNMDKKLLHEFFNHNFKPSFKLNGSQTESQSLERFNSLVSQDGQSSFLLAGGPVWALAWVPQPTNNSASQYLTLSTHTNLELTNYWSEKENTRPKDKRGFIQIWKFKANNTTDKIVNKPQFVKGIAHDFGKIWCVEWCPSGCYETDVSLGLLAASCQDGTVRLLNVGFPSNASSNDSKSDLVKANCIKSLVLSGSCDQALDEADGHCLNLTWYRGKEHRYIAASYQSGTVAIWDIASKSSLLSFDDNAEDGRGRCMLPVQSWNAHHSSVTSISLSIAEDSVHPKYCVTGGSDRYYKFWDLRDTSAPLQEVKRGLVTCVSLLPGLSAAAISHDDVYLQAHTQSLLTDSGYARNSGIIAQPIVAQNSCIWDHCLSSCLGSLALVTSAGELMVYVLPDANKPVDQNRSSIKRRSYVYTLQADKASNDNSVHLRYHNLWGDDKKLSSEDKEIQKKVRYSETMNMEDLTTNYPFISLNRVSWNPNLGARVQLASGGHSGLVRIDILSSLRTATEEE